MVQMIGSLQAVLVPQDKASARGEEGHRVPSHQLSPLGTKRTYDLSAPGGTKFQASCRLHHSTHLHMLHVGGNAGSATDRTQRSDTNTNVCMHSYEAASLDQAPDPELTMFVFFLESLSLWFSVQKDTSVSELGGILMCVALKVATELSRSRARSQSWRYRPASSIVLVHTDLYSLSVPEQMSLGFPAIDHRKNTPPAYFSALMLEHHQLSVAALLPTFLVPLLFVFPTHLHFLSAFLSCVFLSLMFHLPPSCSRTVTELGLFFCFQYHGELSLSLTFTLSLFLSLCQKVKRREGDEVVSGWKKNSKWKDKKGRKKGRWGRGVGGGGRGS